jgi:hypothetical protein
LWLKKEKTEKLSSCMSDEDCSPGVLAVNLLSVGVNNKYVKSSCSHFVTDTVENWQGFPPSPVKVTVGTLGVSCRYRMTFFWSYLGLAEL